MNIRARLLTLLFVAFVTSGVKAQVTYQHYLNYSSEWRDFQGGWDISGSYYQYFTTYFDGDTLLNGNWYYKQFVLQLDSVFSTPPFDSTLSVAVDTYLTSRGYWREDSLGDFLKYNESTSTDDTVFRWAPVLALEIGDTFPFGSCTVQLIDSVYLGSTPIKRIRPAILSGWDTTYWTRGFVEGIAQTMNPCGTGIEGNYYSVCYLRDGNTVQFSPYTPCEAFLTPQRQFSPTAVAGTTLAEPGIRIFPNPATNTLEIRKAGNGPGRFVLYDLLGKNVFQAALEGAVSSVRFQVPAGIYTASVLEGGRWYRQRLVVR